MILVARFRVGCFFLLLGLAGCAKPTVEDTLKMFQGEWEVVFLDRAGKKSDDAALKGMSATVKNDLFSMSESKQRGLITEISTEEFAIQMDLSKPSGEIDFVYLYGPNQGLTRRGIYAFQENQLKVCMGDIGKSRPTEFAGTENPACTLIVLQRRY